MVRFSRFMVVLVSVFLCVSAPANAWFFGGDDHPDESMIMDWVIESVPAHFTVKSLDVNTQDMRTGLQEYSESRVEVVLSLNEDLFKYKEAIGNNVLVYIPVASSGEEFVVYGLARAVPSGKGWRGEFEVDEEFKSTLGTGSTKESISAFREFVIEGSPEYEEAMALHEEERRIEQERLAEEARQREERRLAEEARIKREKEEAERARILRAESVSGIFEGSAVCGSTIYDVERLELNALTGSGIYVWRSVRDEQATYTQSDVRISETRREGIFLMNASGLNSNFSISAKENGVDVKVGSCEFMLHDVENVPSEVLQQRLLASQALDKLSEGIYQVNVFENSTPRAGTVSISDVQDFGFSFSLDHVQNNNGRFNSGDTNRATSHGKVVFLDYLGGVVLNGEVLGRGHHVFGRSCQTKALFEDDEVVLQNIEKYGCWKKFSVPLTKSVE